MAVRISDKQAKEGMMKTFHLVKKVVAISTLAVFAFTVIPQSVDAALPSTGISKQQRTKSLQRSVDERAEMEALKLESFTDLQNAQGLAIDDGEIAGGWFKSVPMNERTPELSMKAVRENGLLLGSVPESAMSEELCLEAVKNAPGVLKRVPARFKTRAVCLEAVSRNGSLLDLVPERLRDLETCMAAVRSDGDALMDVPANLRTQELCLAAVRTSKTGTALDDVPPDLRTKETCLEAVKNSPIAIKFVPAAAKDSEVYAWALAKAQAEGRAGLQRWIQQDVPNSLKTEVLLKAAKINIADVEQK